MEDIPEKLDGGVVAVIVSLVLSVLVRNKWKRENSAMQKNFNTLWQLRIHKSRIELQVTQKLYTLKHCRRLNWTIN